jgi:aryl carrier-like protein
MYKTGDRAAELPNGEIDYKGRIDGQVKVRGYRIELGEVEVAMEKHAAIEQAVATVREDRPGLKRLIGYYVAKHEVSTNDLRKHLASLLPDYMAAFRLRGREGIAAHAQWQDRSQGAACSRCETPRSGRAFAAPTDPVQKTLANVWADLLGIDRVGIDDNFFDLGGNSLLSIQCVAQLEGHGLKLPIVKLYQHPTVRLAPHTWKAMHERRSPLRKWPRPARAARRGGSEEGGHRHHRHERPLPRRRQCGRAVEEPARQEEQHQHVDRDEIDPSVPAELRNDPDYVKARGVITDADKFDAAFFGVNPRVAALMDPQQRVFLETAWAAHWRMPPTIPRSSQASSACMPAWATTPTSRATSSAIPSSSSRSATSR